MRTFVDRKNFTFVSKAVPDDTFEVVQFSGTESISRPYEFTVTLSARDPEIELKEVLRKPATLTVVRGYDEVSFHGVPMAIEQLQEANQRVFYRAVLVPKFWYLGLYQDNRLFLDKSLPQILEEVLKQSGLSSQDYELKLTRSYAAWEYVCQYRETNLDFLSRWMEREGIYYFFKQLESGEKLIITDSLNAHEEIEGGSTLAYSPTAGLIPGEEDVVTGFACRQKVLPKKVILKDYNYRKPSLEVKAEADVDPNGREDVYIYGEHFKDQAQGRELANIRAGEFLCRQTMYYGESTSPRLAPGLLFTLSEHYRSSCNRKLLVTEVEHRGVATGMLLSGLEQNAQAGYSNHFVCIPSDVQFRPERKTARPRFNGTMNAVIDAAGDGSTAELDSQGRYKVILPFDLSGRNGAKASRWIRMAQPYSGADYGVHFPLHKGSEVLLSFIDGDLDRPVISTAVPNPQTQSPVTRANQTKSVIRDNFGNEIIMDATPGDEHILLRSPHHESRVQIGRSVKSYSDSDATNFFVGNKAECLFGTSASFVGGSTAQGMLGVQSTINGGLTHGITLGGAQQFRAGYDVSYSLGPKREIASDDVNIISNDNGLVSAKNTLCLIGGAGDGKTPTDDTASVVCANEDSITMGFLDQKPDICPLGPDFEQTTLLTVLTAATSILSSVLSGVMLDKQAGDKDPFNEATVSSLLGTLSVALAVTLGIRLANPSANIPEQVKSAKCFSKVQINTAGDVHINSNAKKVKDRIVVVSAGKETDDNAIAVADDGIAIEAKANSDAVAAIHLKRKNGNLSMLSKGEILLQSSGGAVRLVNERFEPVRPTEIHWPNFLVKW